MTLSNQVAPAHLVGLKAEKSGFGWFFDGSSSLLKSVSNIRFLMKAQFENVPWMWSKMKTKLKALFFDNFENTKQSIQLAWKEDFHNKVKIGLQYKTSGIWNRL